MPFYENFRIYKEFRKKEKLKNFNFLTFRKYESERFDRCAADFLHVSSETIHKTMSIKLLTSFQHSA